MASDVGSTLRAARLSAYEDIVVGISADTSRYRLAAIAWFHHIAADEMHDLVVHPTQICAQANQHRGGHSLALAHQAKEQMLGADVAVLQLQRFSHREFEHLLGSWSERRGAAGGGDFRADGLLDLVADGIERDAEVVERSGADPISVPMKLWLRRRASS
jgi:hypothetical protein